jgi:hypothetical protein
MTDKKRQGSYVTSSEQGSGDKTEMYRYWPFKIHWLLRLTTALTYINPNFKHRVYL